MVGTLGTGSAKFHALFGFIDIPDLVWEYVVEFQLVICDSIRQIWSQMNQVVELVLQNAGI